jgi:hypothetical protein
LRGSLVFGSVLALVALAQPVAAQCVNRGGAVTCAPSFHPKYPNATQQPPREEPVDPNAKTVVLRPDAPDDANAWVLTPENPGASTAATVASCGAATGC